MNSGDHGVTAAGSADDGARSEDRTRPRLLDVARRAHVSPATVSRVLNGAQSVKEPYRARVLQAIADLEYRPNHLARNLRRQKAEMIGVLVTDIENPHFTQMVRALEDAAYRLGYRVLLCNTDETAEKQRAYLEVLAAERALGVVITPSDPAGPEISDLLDMGIPLVAFDRAVNDPRADAVLVDNVGAGRQATAYLLAAGHTRIGFIGDSRIDTGIARHTGYLEAMRRADLSPHAVDGYSRIEAGARATEAILQHAPTALVVANNLMTIGALRVLRAQGRRVPDEVAVVAIDNPFWSEIIEPPMTVLAQPVRQMADCVIDLLVERLHGARSTARRVIFDCVLVERASVQRLSPDRSMP